MLKILAGKEGILFLTSIISLLSAIINLYVAYGNVKSKKDKVSLK